MKDIALISPHYVDKPYPEYKKDMTDDGVRPQTAAKKGSNRNNIQDRSMQIRQSNDLSYGDYNQSVFGAVTNISQDNQNQLIKIKNIRNMHGQSSTTKASDNKKLL